MSRPLRLAATVARRVGLAPVLARGGLRWILSPRRARRLFGAYEPTARDVVVATYAKSGTNWMLQIALQIAHLGDARFEHVHDLVPWPEGPSRHPIALDDPASWAGSPTGKRVIKTHASFDGVPYRPEARYIVVVRDPKEVVVSAYHFAAPLLGVSAMSPQQWLDTLLAVPAEAPGNWPYHTASWWLRRDLPNVLVLFYADMKRDHGAAVDAVAAHMGVHLTPAQREAVLERSGLPWMKAHNEAFAPFSMPFVAPDHMPVMIRRGAAGGADELYDADARAAIDAYVMSGLEQLGSDFPYGERFGGG